MAWQEVSKKWGGRGGGKILDPRSLVLSKVARNTPSKRSLLFSIGKSLCDEYRLMPGDQVKIFFDFEDRLGKLVRVTDGGYVLSSSGASKKGKKCTRTYCKCRLEPHELKLVFPNGVGRYEAPSVSVMDEGIVFELAPA